jgi:hypothetical protein
VDLVGEMFDESFENGEMQAGLGLACITSIFKSCSSVAFFLQASFLIPKEISKT